MESSRGFSLLEVMIAAAVLGIGLAGVAALTLTAAGHTTDARDRTEAALLASELCALVSLAPSAMETWAEPPSSASSDCRSGCTPQAFAASESARWQARLALALPGASATVCRDRSPQDGIAADPACDGAGPWFVKIFWTRPGGRSGAERLVRRTLP